MKNEITVAEMMEIYPLNWSKFAKYIGMTQFDKYKSRRPTSHMRKFLEFELGQLGDDLKNIKLIP